MVSRPPTPEEYIAQVIAESEVPQRPWWRQRRWLILALLLLNAGLVILVSILKPQWPAAPIAALQRWSGPFSAWQPAVPSPTPSPSLQPPYWKLERTLLTGNETLLTFPFYNVRAATWENQLLYQPSELENNKRIFALDFETGEKQLFLDTAQYEDASRSSAFITLTHFSVYDNTLYFSLSEYGEKGATYWLDLPATQPAQLLAKTDAGQVERLGDHLILRDGQGDGCGSSAALSILDPEKKTLSPLTTVANGCVDGFLELGIDAQNRLLLAEHTWQDGPLPTSLYADTTDHFLSLIAVSLQPPYDQHTIFARDAMPTNVAHISYDKEKNRVLMIGDKNWLVNPETSEKEELVMPARDLFSATASGTLSQAEKTIQSLQLPETYRFILVEK